MTHMTTILKSHPRAVGSNGYQNMLYLEGKVNDQSSPEDHESVYNVKFTTTVGFTLTVGYSRYKDALNTTHAWVMFGESCSWPWQRELGVDLLLNLVGYRCVYGSDLSSSVHPAVGGPDTDTYAPIRSASQAPWPGATPVAKAPAQPSASSSTPALAQAPVPSAQPLAATMLASVPEPAQAPASSAQPLAAMPAQAPAPSAQPLAGLLLMQQVQAKEPEDERKDATDHEGLDDRPVLGEQDPEEDVQRLEDLARSGEWDSEAEELAFKVSAVKREQPPDFKMSLVPKPRWPLAAKTASIWASRWRQLHMSVLSSHGGTQDFGLQEMTCVYGDGRWFIPWMNHQSITRIHDILESREPYAFALVGSARGGWQLCDAIADPDDDDGGKVMSWKKFYGKWEGDVKKVFKHLWKNMRAN